MTNRKLRSSTTPITGPAGISTTTGPSVASPQPRPYGVSEFWVSVTMSGVVSWMRKPRLAFAPYPSSASKFSTIESVG